MKSEKIRPIMIHPDTVALIHVYERPVNTDFQDGGFGWFWESTGNSPVSFRDMAENFLDQAGDFMCIEFMSELSKALRKRVVKHNKMVKEMDSRGK